MIGGWDYAAIRSAFLQGLAADVTDLVAESKMIDKLEDYAKPIWENVWSVEGRYYAAPNAYNVGPGIHYRRDLIQELGLPEPQPGWTWSDVRELAKALTKGKRKGIAMQGLGFSSSVNAEGFEFLSTIPAPETSWNWRRDYMRNVDHWVQIIGDVRAMKFEDQSLLSDITFHDGEIWNAFIREQACMHTNTVVFYTSEPSAGTTHVTLADKLGKPLEEVVGWVPFPVGRNGYASSGFTQPQIDSVSFSPDLDEEELALIFDLHLYMIGDGFVKQKNIVYDKTKDLREIYNFDKITPVLKGTLDGMPGSPDEAWGKQFMDTVRAVTQYPLIPQTAWFFPPEEQVGPTTNAIDDAFSKWWFEPGEVDIAADLERAQNVLNTQAESFTSSVPDEEFVSAANKYYAAHEKFWQQHSPEFYENVFRPFYEEAIKPALSG